MEELKFQMDTSDKIYLTLCSAVLISILFIATIKKV